MDFKIYPTLHIIIYPISYEMWLGDFMSVTGWGLESFLTIEESSEKVEIAKYF